MYKVRATDIQPRLLRKACQFFTYRSTTMDLCLKVVTGNGAPPPTLFGPGFAPMALGSYVAMAMARPLSLSLGMCFWPMRAILIIPSFASSLWKKGDLKRLD